MPAKSAGWGGTITTPYGTARVNTSGRILWAEWEVWRHSGELVEAGLWSVKRSSHGARERVEYYAAGPDGCRTGAGSALTVETAGR